MHFTKLFSSILDSTIWQESASTKLTWITMLAMVNRQGEVHSSIPGLAARTGVSIQECESALASFQSPDPYSRTKDHEGRRVKEIDGGWVLLNHGKYCALLSAEERREYNRVKQAEYRAKDKTANMSLTVIDTNTHVDKSVCCGHIVDIDVEVPPIVPQGGLDVEETEKRKSSLPAKPESKRIAKMFNRKETTGWSSKEIKAFKALLPIDPEDLAAVERYYDGAVADPERYPRKDLGTFLNNFRGEVDRANNWTGSEPEPQFKMPNIG